MAERLGLLQRAGTALTPVEVAERLGGELTYGSVVTILTRMHTKGLLTRIPRGRAYACAPSPTTSGRTEPGGRVAPPVKAPTPGRTVHESGQVAGPDATATETPGWSWKLRDCPPDKHVRVQEARRRWLPRTVGAVSAGRGSVEPSTG
ncbi:BlaI/MecI/CopY family transcriptional regulator [Streptomyces sp. 900105755]